MYCLEKTEELLQDEVNVIETLIEKLQRSFKSVENETFALACGLVAQEMPYRLRKIFSDFRNQKSRSGYLLIRGFPLDDAAIGPTPAHWDTPWENPNTFREEIFQCLIASCVGDIFGWRTQENGRFLRHIVPIKKDEHEQLGGSSSVRLLWHIEEAFHPQRADMMTLMCYRNNEKAYTNICSIEDLDISPRHKTILSERRFIIEPDKSHMPENNQSGQWQLDMGHFEKIRAFLANPEPVAVFQGPKRQERLVLDEAFMTALPGDLEAQEALNWLFQHMNEKGRKIEMQPGEILLIDNRLAAHGRASYVPHYGPFARWMRRVNITADLTKSYEWKTEPSARVIL